MEATFPTLRRLLDVQTWMGFLRPWRASWAQRRSLLRLIVTSAEENIQLSQLIDAWADDETGRQSNRLRHLAALRRGGTPLPEAVEQVPRLLGEDDILAIRFGMQSGTLAATLRERLEQPDPSADDGAVRYYRTAVYFCAFTVIAIAI